MTEIVKCKTCAKYGTNCGWDEAPQDKCGNWQSKKMTTVKIIKVLPDGTVKASGSIPS